MRALLILSLALLPMMAKAQDLPPVPAAPATIAVAATPSATVPTLLIGTGTVTGIYFPTAGAIQRSVNDSGISPVRLAVQSTGGSVSNLQDLATGKLDMAIAQSDWATYAAKGGQAQFLQPNTELRSLLALHSELLTIIVKNDSNITNIDGLKGKKINLGPVGSGPRTIMSGLFQTLGWGVTELGSLSDLPFAEQAKALCEGKVDAIVYIVPHPNAAVQEALTSCPTKMLPINGLAVDHFVSGNSFYAKGTIPAGMYSNQNADIPAFGVRALLVATTKLSDDAAYAIVKSIYGDIPQLTSTHSALARLSAADLSPAGFAIPVHSGAAKYFAEIKNALKP